VPPTHSSNHPLHPRDVPEQSEQRRRRRDKPAAGLVFGEAVEGHLEGASVLLHERLELDALVVQQHVERTHRSLPSRRTGGGPRRRRS
jgi:hypothetical protein